MITNFYHLTLIFILNCELRFGRTNYAEKSICSFFPVFIQQSPMLELSCFVVQMAYLN